jgi:Zn-dependent protease with chaperone function
MAGLLLCIVAIVIGFSYPEDRLPAHFSTLLTINSVIILAFVCWIAGGLASHFMRRRLEAGFPRAAAAVLYAKLRKISWLVVLSAYAVCVHFFDYPYLIRGVLGLRNTLLLEELLVLAPFFIFATANLEGLYPGDKLLRRSSWSVWRFQGFYLRQFLVPAVPFLAFSTAYDLLTAIPAVEESMYVYPFLLTVAFAFFIFAIFTLAPLLFRLLWKVERLPDGPLRRRVEEMAASNGVSYRDILVWHTGGSNIANAMVTGVFGQMRYIFVTDALVALLPEDEVVAVLAHELGHAKHRHMQIYLALAISFVALINSADYQVNSLLRLLVEDFGISPEIIIIVYSFVLLAVFWGLIFGFTSRRLEQAADVFAARNVSPATFGAALDRIGFLSGGSRTMSSWRHFSLDKRVRFMEKAAAGEGMGSFSRGLKAAFTVVTVVVALGAAAFFHQIYASTDARGRFERKSWYAWHNKDYERATGIARTGLRAYPQSVELYYVLGTSLYQMKKYEQGLEVFADAIEVDPDSDFYYELGRTLVELDRLQEARIALLQATRLEPDRADYRRELARVERLLGLENEEDGPLRRNGDTTSE